MYEHDILTGKDRQLTERVRRKLPERQGRYLDIREIDDGIEIHLADPLPYELAIMPRSSNVIRVVVVKAKGEG